MENSGAQIVTVTYGEKTATYTINVKDPQNNSYTLSGGKFFEGTYLIGSLSGENTYNFMKAEIVSSRFSYSSLTISNDNNVSTSDPLLAWKIEKDGDYYTLFNEKTETVLKQNGIKVLSEEDI